MQLSPLVPRMEKRLSAHTVWACLGLLTLVCLLLFRRYYIGPYQYLFLDASSDTLRINLPTYYMLWDILSDGLSGWSMKMGIGTSVLSHADVLFDPFTYFAFLGGRAHIANLLILPVLLKIVCAGLFCYGYLRSFSLRRGACAVACFAYAFSGYMLVMGRNYVFATICVYLPLILWGLERFLQQRRHGVLLVGLFLTAIYFYYFFYMVALLVAVYALVRLVMLRASRRVFVASLLRLAGLGILALLLACFIVLPTVLLTLQSSRLSSTGIDAGSLLAPDWRALFTALARMFGADSAGVFEIWNYAGYGVNYFELATFTSALCVLVFPQYLCLCQTRQRRTTIALLLLVAAAILLPVVSYAFNGFSALTYRWSFVLNLLLAVCCALGLHTVLRERRVHTRALLLSLLSCWGLLLLSQTALLFWEKALPRAADASLWTVFRETYLQHPSALLGYGFLAVYAVIFLLRRMHRFSPLLLCACLLVTMSGEIAANYYHWLHNSVAVTRQPTHPQSTYFDDSNRFIQALRSDDAAFYRIGKNYDSVRDLESGLISDNDAMSQGFYGLQSYNSQNQPHYIAFLQRMGIFVTLPLHTPAPNEAPEDMTGTALNFINGVGTRYAVASYLGTKYYLVKEPFQPTPLPDNRFYYYSAANEPVFLAPDYFTLLSEQDGLRCYRNEAYFPFAFSRSRFVRESDFALLTNEEKDRVLAQYGVVDDTAAILLAAQTVPAQAAAAQSAPPLAETAAQYRAQLTALSVHTDSDIAVTLTVPDDRSIVTFTTPYEDGWHITMDGAPVTALRTDCGMLGVLADAGTHTFRLRYVPRGMLLGSLISLFSAAGLLGVFVWNKRRLRRSSAHTC